MTDPRLLPLLRALLDASAPLWRMPHSDGQLLLALLERVRNAPALRLRHLGSTGTAALATADGSLHGLALAYRLEGEPHPGLLRGVVLAEAVRKALSVPVPVSGPGPWWDYCAWHWTRREDGRCAECDREADAMLAESDERVSAFATGGSVRHYHLPDTTAPVRFPWEYADEPPVE